MLEEFKEYLDITWDEEDKSLNSILERGKLYLEEKAGVSLLFEGTNKQLLFDYGRYVRNNSFELFEINFKRELLSLSLREAVAKRESGKKNSESSS